VNERNSKEIELEAFKQAGNNDEVKKQLDAIQKQFEEKNGSQFLVDEANTKFDDT
jgi:hypothetical protein